MGKVTRIRIAYAAGATFEEVTEIRTAQAAGLPLLKKWIKTTSGLLDSFDPARRAQIQCEQSPMLERLRSMALVLSSLSGVLCTERRILRGDES